jgi:alpha-1,6-mannosyltransferase
MKLVDVNEFYSDQGGGVRSYVDAKLAAGAAQGHEVVVIAPGDADREERRHGGRIVWVRSALLPFDRRYRLLTRGGALRALLDREAPDVVESSSALYGSVVVARWQPGRALKSLIFHQDLVAVYGHTLLARQLTERAIDRLCGGYFAGLRWLSRRFDLTVTGGEWLARRLSQLGVHAPTAVAFGVDKSAFSPRHRSETLRRVLLDRAGLPASARLLVGVSRHHPEKRLFTLLSAMARCGAAQRVGLVIYGDGPLRKVLEWKAAHVPGVVIAGRIENRSELARVLASADGLLHGSAAETFGLSVAEALCSGLPLVVPDRGGAAELAGPRYAERYAAGDPRACAAAIERLLAREPATLRAAAAGAARARVRSADEHFSALFSLYAQRIKARRTAAPAR